MFSLLNKFTNNDESSIDFAPELNIYHITTPSSPETFITITASSGDSDNTTKNFKQPSKNISGISFELDFSENNYNQSNVQLANQFITGKALLVLDFYDDLESKKIELASHKIEITPHKDKKTKTITYPTKEEAEHEVKLAWQEVFSVALEEYENSLNGRFDEPKSVKKAKSKIDKLISVISIVVIIMSVGYVVINKNMKNTNTQTITNEINPQRILQNAQVGITQESTSQNQIINSSEKTLEQEVLSEFGLEEGINLDK